MPSLQAPLFVCLMLLCGASHAHLLKVFAIVEEGRIEGYAYFAGGARAAGAKVRIATEDGRTVAELQPDAAGAFSHSVGVRGDYRVVADSGDGHRAEWRVAASEFGGEFPGADGAAGARRAAAAEGAARAEGASTKGAGATGASAKEAASAEGSASSESAALNADRADASLPRAARDRVQPAVGEVEALVEGAVARQIRPLREALEAERSRARLHDILGGLGYIAGLAGLALWWRSRKGVSAP